MGVVIPLGLVLPEGTLVAPGTVLPPTWSPGDPLPEGIAVSPGTEFPSGWTPGDPEPEGVTLEPGVSFPPDWTPPDPVPDGLYPAPSIPPETQISGPTPPAYAAPWEPGPITQPGKAAAPAAEPPDFTENWNACTVQNYWTPLNTPTAFVADNAGWKYYLDTAAQGGSQLLTYASYLEPRTYNSVSDTYVYIKDTADFRLRYLTQIKIRTRRASGAGSPLCALWDAAPPGGNLLWSEILTASGSATFQTWTDPGDFSGYSDLHFGFAIGLGAQRYQRLYSVEIT